MNVRKIIAKDRIMLLGVSLFVLLFIGMVDVAPAEEQRESGLEEKAVHEKSYVYSGEAKTGTWADKYPCSRSRMFMDSDLRRINIALSEEEAMSLAMGCLGSFGGGWVHFFSSHSLSEEGRISVEFVASAQNHQVRIDLESGKVLECIEISETPPLIEIARKP